jgi:hypothetical protein
MAKIVPSDEAPNETVLFALAGTEPFELDAGGSLDDPSREQVVEAEVHPWLDVVYDQEEGVDPYFREIHPTPAEDHLSAQNDVSFDPQKVEEDRQAVLGQDDAPVAVESGKDQTEPVTSGGIAETVAAIDTDEEDRGF